MVLTAEQTEEHTYQLVAIEEGEIGTEYEIYQCTKPGCTQQKIEEIRRED